MCGFCGAWQRVDQEPRRGRSAAAVRVPGWFGIDPAEVAVLLQQPQGWLEVGGLAKATAGGLVGVAAAELDLVGAADPIQ